jgi:predicted glycoside hydrolase/deacetylase ChbG (UPF0249 family)
MPSLISPDRTTLQGVLICSGAAKIMCPSVYVDEAFVQESVYNSQHERELKILADPTIKQAIQVNGIELFTFADL